MRRLICGLGTAVLLIGPAMPAIAAAPASVPPATTADAEKSACLGPSSPVPGPLADRVIVVDPGHGVSAGTTTGADGVNGVAEDTNAVDIGCRLVYLLSSEGADVYITRGLFDPGPPPVQGLIARVNFAESVRADLFVSIHQNDGTAADSGVSTYYTKADSRTLADDIQAAMVATTGLRDDGTQTAPFYVTRNTSMPSVLVEGGFLSNAAEAALISTPDFHEAEAEAINRGLLGYFGKGLPAVAVGAAGTGVAAPAVAAVAPNVAAPSAASAGPAPSATVEAPAPAPAAAPPAGAKGASSGTAEAGAAGSPSGPAAAAMATRVLDLVATAYGPSLQDNYPYGPVDFFGKPLVAGDVAVDPRVIPLGTHLYVSGYDSPYLPAGGFSAVARDTGGAIKGDRIDIFIDGSPAEVASFGVQHVKVAVLGG